MLACVLSSVKWGQGIRLFLRLAETESISGLLEDCVVWRRMAKKEAHGLQRQTYIWLLRKLLILSECHGRDLLSSTPKPSRFSPANTTEPLWLGSRWKFLISRKVGLSLLPRDKLVMDSVCDQFLNHEEVKGSLRWRFLSWIKRQGLQKKEFWTCYFLPAWDPGVKIRCLGLWQPSCNQEAKNMKTKSQHAKNGKSWKESGVLVTL